MIGLFLYLLRLSFILVPNAAFQSSPGLGLRLDTPVGLLRADVGFPRSLLPTSRSTTRKARWYFGFGHIF